ncbi:hypothetical protein F383_36174 [Gossypium arboreum]|uniref:Uncharacterized protein n=1 Tax=Gossypium arboreum TaxID=29729 RepID=A0A0B0NAY3_GOSAR|nr:hypothetical protein F383_36174 [Gossypium arboreum]
MNHVSLKLQQSILKLLEEKEHQKKLRLNRSWQNWPTNSICSILVTRQ